MRTFNAHDCTLAETAELSTSASRGAMDHIPRSANNAELPAVGRGSLSLWSICACDST
jgi:hypothetical protein